MESYEPIDFHQEKAEEILLVSTIPSSHVNYLQIVRKHFLILAQRYHPDKNDTEHSDVCNSTMSTLNQAFCAVEAKYHNGQKDKTTAVKDGKVFNYPAKEIITCQHHESFAIYGHPEYLEGWKALIEKEWGVPGIAKNADRTVQYGNSRQSLFITIYPNGTIFIQGNLAVSYSLENVWRLISMLRTPTNMKANKRSSAFKEAIKLFPNTSFKTPEPLSLMNEITVGHSIGSPSDNQNFSPSSQSSKFGGQAAGLAETTLNTLDLLTTNDGMMQLLQSAVLRIVATERKLENMEAQHAEFRKETESTIKKLKEDNQELRRTIGPKISRLLQDNQRPNDNENTEEHSIDEARGNQRWLEAAKKGSTKPTPKADAHKRKLGRIEFDVKKVAVIEKIVNTDNSTRDDNIRRELGKHFDNVIVDRIEHYTNDKRKILIQMATEEMRQTLIDGWETKAPFGGSSIRKPYQQRLKTCGIAKAVPLNITDEEFEQELHKLYPSASFVRLSKGEKKLRAIKIDFKSTATLKTAVQNSLKLENAGMFVRVEEYIWKPNVWHCRNCWKIGHITRNCSSPKACEHCGKQKDSGDHLSCKDNPTCVNCKGKHSAVQTSECNSYNKRYKLLEQRYGSQE